ncbi:MAG: hypothetical protein E2O39_07625 [Planctomycetota bacterium]|nr:MAG: hypothetical protein E2O39_07625 [Planctomycetota bacterium]
MKELLRSLASLLKSTNGPTRVVIAAALVLALAVAGIAGFRASNPTFVLLETGLDAQKLSSVSAAIANKGIRFKPSYPPGPYTIWVEASREYEARNAMYIEGAMASDPRGIETSASGAATVFLGHGERLQQMQKRKEGEVEKLLEDYTWIAKATISSSTPARSSLTRVLPPTISVVLQLRGILEPDREQRETVATIVRSAFGAPRENVVISDQFGRTLYDGTRDNSLDELLAFQRQSDASETARIQAVFDDVYGPGLVRASVSSEWTHDQVESISETVDPTSKVRISKTESTTETPVGGPAGVSSSILDPSASARVPEPATTSDTTEEFAIGRSTTHTLQMTPVLKRLTLTLLVDESLAEKLADVEEAGKTLVRFDEARGDVVIAITAAFFSLERDQDGNPVPPEPAPLPETTNPTLELLIEHGVEILAALAFLFVLLRGLKKGTAPVPPEAATAAAHAVPDEEIDVDMLARKHVEQLLTSDPEKVSALLSRWALSESPLLKTDA